MYSQAHTLPVFHVRLQVRKPRSKCSSHLRAHLINMDEVLATTGLLESCCGVVLPSGEWRLSDVLAERTAESARGHGLEKQ